MKCDFKNSRAAVLSLRRHGCCVMRISGRLLVCLLICLGMTGCLYLPTPHKEWVAPPASGRVVDAQTKQAIGNAMVTRFTPENITAQARTDTEGRFELAGVRKLRWFHLDRTATAAYHIEASGYQMFETRKGGWAFRKDLRHDLGEIPLQPEP